MPIQTDKPAEIEQSPYLPPGPKPIVWEQFEGVNTSTTRAGVPDSQMYWCCGFMPIGPRQLRTIYGVGAALWTPGSSRSIVLYQWVVLGNVPTCIVVLSDGSIYQVTSTGTVTQIAAIGTITQPSQYTVGISQWSNQYAIIVANQTNGYWLWDGKLLYTAGTIAPNAVLTYVGSGYTSAPTVTVFGGSGTGASVTAVVSGGVVTSLSIISVGHGYQATDAVGLAFSGGGISSSTAIAQAVISGGTLSTVNILNVGAGYSNSGAASVTFLGGGGTGAVGSVHVASGTVAFVTLTSFGNGYVTAPTPIITDPNNHVAQGSLSMMPFAISGTTVEVYKQRVWVANGATFYWTAPGSVADFATSDGGGNQTSSDAYLKNGYTRLKQANGFLYLIGDSSVDYISNVQTTGAPPTTNFTKQNVDPEKGTPYPYAVELFGRDIIFANDIGVHAIYGAAVTKVSDAVDGVYGSIKNFGGVPLSACKSVNFQKPVWQVLARVNDPITKADTTEVICWNGQKKWWATEQDVSLNFVATQEYNSQLTAWGTDGLSLYPLFQQPSTGFIKRVQSRLWDAPGGYQLEKAAVRFWAVFHQNTTNQITVSLTLDNEHSSFSQPAYSFTTQKQSILVKNASGTTIPCKNASAVTIPVYSFAGPYFMTDPQAVGLNGQLIGQTLYSSAADFELVSTTIQDEIVAYLG